MADHPALREPADSGSAAGRLVPLSVTQEPVWLEQLRYGDRINAGFFSVTIRGPVAAGPVRAACLAICRRNPELRGLVTERDGQFRIEIHDAEQVFDFRQAWLPCERGGENQASRAWYLARRPAAWDLTSQAPIRFFLLEHGESRRTLLVAVHHIAFDGRSKFVFARQFITELRGQRAGGQGGPHEECLDAPPHEHARGTSVAHPADEAGPELAAALRYWQRSNLPALPALALPQADAADPGPGVGTTPRFELPATVCGRLAAVAAQSGTSFFAGLLAATALLLGRYGNHRLVLCIPADTSTEATRHRIGMQVNMVPCLLDLHPAATFGDLVGEARRALENVHRYRRVPFHLLMREIRKSHAVDIGPGVFDRVGLSYPRIPAGLGQVPGLTLDWDFFAPNSSQSFQLTLQLRRTGDGLFGRLDYYTSVFDAETATEFVREWRRGLEQALADPGAPVCPSPPRPKAGRPAACHGPPLGERIRFFAARQPEARCLSSGPARLRYRDLAGLPERAGPVGPLAVRPREPAEAVHALASPGAPRAGPEAGAAGVLAASFLAGHVSEADQIWAAAGGRRLAVAGHPPGSAAFMAGAARALSLGAEILAPAPADTPGLLAGLVGRRARCVVEGGQECAGLLAGAISSGTESLAGAITLLCPADQFLPGEDSRKLAAAGVRVVLILDDHRAGPVAWGEWRPQAPGQAPVLQHTARNWRPVVVTPDGRELPPKVPGVLALRPAAGGAALLTGFRARISHGSLHFLGPRDQAVAHAGRLLDGTEAERRIAALPGVRDVAVLPAEDGGHPAPAVLLVPSEPAGTGEERAWRRRVQRGWPAEAVRPSSVTVTGRLPRTWDGAVDRCRARAIVRGRDRHQIPATHEHATSGGGR